MDTDYLREFILLHQCSSFSLAAMELNISQSSLSKHMMQLEKDFGFKLFDRSTHHVRLSPLGERVLPYCEDIIKKEDELLLECEDISLDDIRLRLVSIPVTFPYGIADGIIRFQRDYPDYSVDFEEAEDERIVSLLNQGKYELAFMRVYKQHEKAYEYLPIHTDNLVVCLPKNHPLCNKKTIQLSDLKYEPLIINKENTVIGNVITQVFKDQGITPNITTRTNRLGTNLDFVNQGFGAALIFETPAQYYKKENTVILPLSPSIQSEICLVRLRNHKMSEAALTFWKFIQQNLPQSNT